MGANNVWEKAKRDQDGEIDKTWAALHPENYWVTTEKAETLLDAGKIEEAIPLLEKSIEIYPGQTGASSAYARLARIYREQKELEKEKRILNQWAKLDGEATEALLRLVELELEAKDYTAAIRHSKQLLEINPLHPLPHRASAESLASEGEDQGAIKSFQTVLKLEPPDRADVHYRLARLFKKQNSPDAKRHVLLALEEAPRFRAAHQLLLELIEN